MVAGHVYGNPMESVLGLYPPFKNQFDYILETPNLYHAVFTGDVVRSSSNDEHWDLSIADMDLLGIDYHIAAGNHDRSENFLERFGEYYYSFMVGSDLFIILNTFQWNIENEQQEFLFTTINENENAENIFLFCHELIWWSPDSIFQNIGINNASTYPGSSNYWNEISPFLVATEKPIFLFSGDVGALWGASPYAYYAYENIQLIASGMGRNNGSNYLIIDVFHDGSVKINLKATEGDPDKLGDITLYELP